MTGHEAGQHAGIGGGRIGIDQRHTHARQRPHAPAFQHQRMGVPAADKHKVTGKGQGGAHARRQSDNRRSKLENSFAATSRSGASASKCFASSAFRLSISNRISRS